MFQRFKMLKQFAKCWKKIVSEPTFLKNILWHFLKNLERSLKKWGFSPAFSRNAPAFLRMYVGFKDFSRRRRAPGRRRPRFLSRPLL
jgi:hypothetical protein